MKQPPPMTPLDELTSSPELRMLKLFLTFLPHTSQHTLAVFIKFLEFRQALELSLPCSPPLASQELSGSAGLFPENLLQNLRPYLTPQEQQIFEMFENIQNMLSVMELFRAAEPPVSGFSLKATDARSTDSASTTEQFQNNSFSQTDLLMNLLSPEQRSNFKLYNDLFSSLSTPDHNPQNQSSGRDFESTKQPSTADSSSTDNTESFHNDEYLNMQSNTLKEETTSPVAAPSAPQDSQVSHASPLPSITLTSQKGDITHGKLDESSRNETDRSRQAGTDQTGSQSDAGEERT